MPWTLLALRREGNQAAVAAWWPENSKEGYAAGLEGLAAARQNWSARRIGCRKQGRGRESGSCTTGAIRVADQSHVGRPRIGRVRAPELTTVLRKRLAAGTACIRRARVTREGGRWDVRFTGQVWGVKLACRTGPCSQRVENPQPRKPARREDSRRKRARAAAPVANMRRAARHQRSTRLARTSGTHVGERFRGAGRWPMPPWRSAAARWATRRHGMGPG